MTISPEDLNMLIERQREAQKNEQPLEFLVPHGRVLPVIKKQILMENVKTMADFGDDDRPTHYGRYSPIPVDSIVYFGQSKLVFIINRSYYGREGIWIADNPSDAAREEQKRFMHELPSIDRQDMLMIDAFMNWHNMPPNLIYLFLTGKDMPEVSYSGQKHKQMVHGPIDFKDIEESMPNPENYPSISLDELMMDEGFALIVDMSSPWAEYPGNLKMMWGSIDNKYYYMSEERADFRLFQRSGSEDGNTSAEAIRLLRQNAQAFAEFALFDDAFKIYSFLAKLPDKRLKDYVIMDAHRQISSDTKALRYEFINNAAYQLICQGNAGLAIEAYLKNAAKEYPTAFILNNLATAHAMRLELRESQKYFMDAYNARHPTAGRSFNQVEKLLEAGVKSK